MSTMRLTDDAIRAALTPAVDVRAPAGLADEIQAAIETTPQRRRAILAWPASRRLSLVLQLVLVGLLLLALVGVLLLAGSHRPPVPGLVSTYHGGPERTGVMPGPGPTGSPKREWEAAVKGPIGAWSPAVVDGTVYTGDESGYVSAIAETTGVLRWQVDVGAPINSGVSIVSGLLLVGDDNGVIHALDVTRQGAQVWTYQAGGPVHSSAAVVEDVAYFGSLDGHLYALDVATGKLRWPAPIATPGPISRAIAVANGVIYAGSGNGAGSGPGMLGAYDTKTGALLWSVPLEPGNTSTPTIVDGRVFVAGGLDSTTSTSHHLYAFDAATGRPAWAVPLAAPSGKAILLGAVTGGQVFAPSVDGLLYVVDASTGSLAWTRPIGASLSPNAGFVAGLLYITSDDRKVHAIDISTHAELWAFAVTGTPSAPAVIDGRIIVGTSLGKVVSIVGSGDPSGSATAP
jgi:outer membrane protein assembly factor BamB